MGEFWSGGGWWLTIVGAIMAGLTLTAWAIDRRRNR